MPEKTPDERNQVALWMIEHGYATGHGDTVADMLDELEAQVEERERARAGSNIERDE